MLMWCYMWCYNAIIDKIFFYPTAKFHHLKKTIIFKKKIRYCDLQVHLMLNIIGFICYFQIKVQNNIYFHLLDNAVCTAVLSLSFMPSIICRKQILYLSQTFNDKRQTWTICTLIKYMCSFCQGTKRSLDSTIR